MESAKTKITLDKLPIGSRLMVRSRVDWRFAAVSKIADGRVVLTVCSPKGRTYRLRRDFDAEVDLFGQIPVLKSPLGRDFPGNLGSYDLRW
jgi:hypothetical protein